MSHNRRYPYLRRQTYSKSRNDCVISCIQNTNVQNCRATSVHFSNPIVTQMSDNYALIIPSTKALRIKKTCEHPGYLLIDKPSLIEISQHYDISGDSFRFSNKDDFIIGHSFLTKYPWEVQINLLNIVITSTWTTSTSIRSLKYKPKRAIFIQHHRSTIKRIDNSGTSDFWLGYLHL
ncbi:hypothetical protein Zmor_006345 [Zophobas morio]|uniref:Uncharacterized protein n=1 Tax=Zophobas morio TaxID=2755281 RepID=A0AA38ITM0_9CUCU|nr:hypothetical protein Zmor_006345 [Zophobas morio]